MSGVILAIDPGTTESGWCILGPLGVISSGVDANGLLLKNLRQGPWTAGEVDTLAVEMIASYGMPVGKEIFQTVLWIGRYIEAWENNPALGFVDAPARLLYRKDIKLHLCGNYKAKDPHIRQRLLDLVGPQGTKKEPGPTYGVSSHAWAALAVAVVAREQNEP